MRVPALLVLIVVAAAPVFGADGLCCFKVRDTQARTRSVATVIDEAGSQKCRVRLPASRAETCVPEAGGGCHCEHL